MSKAANRKDQNTTAVSFFFLFLRARASRGSQIATLATLGKERDCSQSTPAQACREPITFCEQEAVLQPMPVENVLFRRDKRLPAHDCNNRKTNLICPRSWRSNVQLKGIRLPTTKTPNLRVRHAVFSCQTSCTNTERV